MTYQIGFVIEQALGHVTHGQNLQKNVAQDPTVKAHWALPRWQTSGLGSKIPVYKSNWTVQAGLQTRHMLRQIGRQTKLDAIFFHTQITAVLAQDWMRKIPSIVSLDATPLQYDSLGEFYAHEAGPSALENWKWRLNRDCYRTARHIVTWSEWAKQGLVDAYEVPAEKITVIPPGVNVNEWTNPAPRRYEQGDPVKILFVGGNLERKGGLVLLEAFRTLRQSLAAAATSSGGHEASPVELHLVTRDTLPPEPGLFIYNNMQPNSQPLKELYYQSDLFCLPTFGDCLPMVLSEAGATGLPTISTNVAAIPEIVADGDTGFIVPPGNVEALTAVLQRLIIDPHLRRHQGENAVQTVSALFDAQANARQLLHLIKDVAAENKTKI